MVKMVYFIYILPQWKNLRDSFQQIHCAKETNNKVQDLPWEDAQLMPQTLRWKTRMAVMSEWA